ncbi:MAG: hypothetical protein GY696_00570 [Gammaproteobacteria bacterium]|nr:hypothetical protein [Gammaproteobacteria bacterium]
MPLQTCSCPSWTKEDQKRMDVDEMEIQSYYLGQQCGLCQPHCNPPAGTIFWNMQLWEPPVEPGW